MDFSFSTPANEMRHRWAERPGEQVGVEAKEEDKEKAEEEDKEEAEEEEWIDTSPEA